MLWKRKKNCSRNSLTLSTFSYADVRDGGIFNRLSTDWAATDQIHAILAMRLAEKVLKKPASELK